MLFDQEVKTKTIVATPLLSKEQTKEVLDEFLSSLDRPEFTMNFYQLDGYVRARVVGPETTNPKEWMSLIFVDQNPNFSDTEQELMITHALNSLYNTHMVQLLNNTCELPCSHEYSESRSDRTNIEQWARGFMQGFIVCQERWNFFLEESQTEEQVPAIIKNTIYDEIDATLLVISSVADAEYAQSQGATPDDLKRTFHQLPEQIVSYGKVGQLMRKYM